MAKNDSTQHDQPVTRWNPHRPLAAGRSLLAVTVAETQGYSKHEVDKRLMSGAPQVAIHANSESHPAAVYDPVLARMLAHAVWKAGGVAYISAQPVVCDGIAQEHDGMKYSLVSRNRMARVYNEVMHALGCNASIVLQTCDKQPTGAVGGAVVHDRYHQKRGHEPVSVIFLPAPVMRPGPINKKARQEVERLRQGLESRGDLQLRDRLMANHVQTNTAVKSIIDRTIFSDIVSRHPQLLNPAQMAALEHELIPDAAGSGGMCAFNGTANSTRNVTSALGLVPEGGDLLSGPYTEERAEQAVALLFHNMEQRIGIFQVVRENLTLACRVWSATGGSTNLALHFSFLLNALGMEGNLESVLALRGEGVPDLFDLKVEEQRSFWELAQQVVNGFHSGMSSLVRTMGELGVIGDAELNAVTVSGVWRERAAKAIPIAAAKEGQQIYLTQPMNATSGIQAVKGNLGNSAVIKISGVRREKIDRFDGKVFLAASYLSEEEATVAIADREAFFDTMATHPGISREVLLAAARHNLGLHREEAGDLEGLERKELVAGMLRRKALMIVVTIGGVGIKAVGMPEMCVISHDINYNPMLADTCLLLTDGRISGTNKGFVIVHLEPEAYERGPILGVTTGDLVHLDLDASRNTQYLNLIDPDKFSAGGEIIPLSEAAVRAKVDAVAEERLEIVESHRALLEPFLLGDLEGLSNAFAGGTPLPLMAAGREAN